MKTMIMTALVIYMTMTTFSQTPTYEWVQTMGAIGQNAGISLDIDPNGDIISTGFFEGTVDFDPGPRVFNLTSSGSGNIFIQKIDGNGQFVWAKSIVGNGFGLGYHLKADLHGNIFITGWFQGTADFDPGPGITSGTTSGGTTACYVLKLDSNGDLVWAKYFDSLGPDDGSSIALDPMGNVYLTGAFSDTLDFDPGPGVNQLIPNGGNDIFILKLTPQGNLAWVKKMGGIGFDSGLSIAVDRQGNTFTSGTFEDSVVFDPRIGASPLISKGSRDIFIQKLDSLGNFQWVKHIGGPGLDDVVEIILGPRGQLYLVGGFESIVDFDPGSRTQFLNSAGRRDGYTLKLDPHGNFLWANRIGGSFWDQNVGIKTDSLGNIYVAGYIRGSADLNPGPGVLNYTSAGGSDFFIQKLDSAANHLWSLPFGGMGDDISAGIVLDSQLQLYNIGQFQSTVDFDPGQGIQNRTTQGSGIYLQKLRQCVPVMRTDSITACSMYTWIDGNTYTTSNNSASYTFVKRTAQGCDSTVSLNLTIISPSYRIDTVEACDEFTWTDGRTYQQSTDTPSYILQRASANGCDSVVSLRLTINSVSDITTSSVTKTVSANNPHATYQWLNCDNKFQPLVGETNQDFTAKVDGSYAVELTENGCVDTSACVAITNVNLDRPGTPSGIRLFPNPSNGRLTISLPHPTSDINVQVHDLQGRLIYTEKYQPTDLVELTLEAPNGIYSITLATNEWTESMTFLKE